MKRLRQGFFCIIAFASVLALVRYLACHHSKESDPFPVGELTPSSVKLLPENSIYDEAESQVSGYLWDYYLDNESGLRNLITINPKRWWGNPQWKKDEAYCVREGLTSGNYFYQVPCEFSLTAKNDDLHVVFFHSEGPSSYDEVGYAIKIENRQITLTNLATNETIPLRDCELDEDTVKIKFCAFSLYKPRYDNPWEEEEAYKYEETKAVYKFIVNNQTLCFFISSAICGAFDVFHGDFYEIKAKGCGGMPDGIFMPNWRPVYEVFVPPEWY